MVAGGNAVLKAAAEDLFQTLNWLHVDRLMGDGRLLVTPRADAIPLPMLGTTVSFTGTATVEYAKKGPKEWSATLKFLDYEITGIIPGRAPTSEPLVGRLQSREREYVGVFSLETFRMKFTGVEFDLDVSQPSDVSGAHTVSVGTIVDRAVFERPFLLCYAPIVLEPINITPPIFPEDGRQFVQHVMETAAPAPAG